MFVYNTGKHIATVRIGVIIIMIKKADSSLVHSKNQMALLNTIFDLNSTSRSELSRILKLSKPSVAEHLSLLLERGIITEEDDGHFSGRKPRAVHFCPSFCYIVAVDLHYDDPTFVLSDLSGKILDEFSIRVKKSTPFELRLNSLINGIHMLLNANTIDPKKLLSIAVSAPGVYTSDSHVSFSNKQHSSWNTNRLLLELQSEFKTNVFFSNDAKAAAVGEYTELARDNINNLVYVSCGLGIGAGIILNGKLFSGNGNAAGEIFNYITPENLEKNLNLENKVSILSVLESVKSHKEKYSSSFYSDIPPDELCFSHLPHFGNPSSGRKRAWVCHCQYCKPFNH